ncbi:putative membrane transporter protein YfcA [subsurface metagenome]
MYMEWYMYFAVVGIGLLAGFVNTLAGGGSALSVPMLIFLGLPANVANGTNRIAILLQNAVGTASFAKERVLDLKVGLRLGLISVIGAILGAAIAVNLNEFIMRRTIGVVLILILILVVFKPDFWIKSRVGGHKGRHQFLSYTVFFLAGIYGGFIQIGTGFFLLTGLVLFEGLNLVKANAIKVFIILLYTPLALLVFILNDQVDYKLGLVLAIGNMAGAWIGSKVAVKRGPKFIRWVLIVALAGSSIKLFGII